MDVLPSVEQVGSGCQAQNPGGEQTGNVEVERATHPHQHYIPNNATVAHKLQQHAEAAVACGSVPMAIKYYPGGHGKAIPHPDLARGP